MIILSISIILIIINTLVRDLHSTCSTYENTFNVGTGVVNNFGRERAFKNALTVVSVAMQLKIQEPVCSNISSAN